MVESWLSLGVRVAAVYETAAVNWKPSVRGEKGVRAGRKGFVLNAPLDVGDVTVSHTRVADGKEPEHTTNSKGDDARFVCIFPSSLWLPPPSQIPPTFLACIPDPGNQATTHSLVGPFQASSRGRN